MTAMNRIFVFYDDRCPLCQRARSWAITQPAFLPVEFWPLHGDHTRERFPDLGRFDANGELVVFSDDGRVYLGVNAWIVVLWALREWRTWSLRLAQPGWKPFARRFWRWVSLHRFDRLPGRLGREEVLRGVLENLGPGDFCAPPPRPASPPPLPATPPNHER
jgi:predicted DCC family thiol-disulfide oxidoreductase YuxK